MGLPTGSWSVPKAPVGDRLPWQASRLGTGLGRRWEGRLCRVDRLVEHEVDVGGVVDELGVLDVLAEAGVGDGGDEGQHRWEQVGGSFGFAARYGPFPGVGEPAAGQCLVVGRQRSGEGRASLSRWERQESPQSMMT